MAILETRRLHLERLSAAHAAEMLPGLQDTRAYEFIADRPPETLPELESRYRRLGSTTVSPDGKEEWCNWIIRHKEERIVVGYIQATVDVEHRDALVAYHLFPKYWGNGYAREAVRWMLQNLFDNLGVERAIALIDTRNVRSIALAKGLGFRLAKTIKDAAYFNGATSDEYEFILEKPQRGTS